MMTWEAFVFFAIILFIFTVVAYAIGEDRGARRVYREWQQYHLRDIESRIRIESEEKNGN